MEDVLGFGKVVERVVDPVIAIIEKIAGPAAEEVGLTLRDSVHVYRAKRAYKLSEKFMNFCIKHRIEPRPVNLKVLLPILDAASVEDDDDLHTMWATLLASAAMPGDSPKPYPAFISTLRQLSSEEARFLNAVLDDLEEKAERWNALPESEEKQRTYPYNQPMTSGELARLYLTVNQLPLTMMSTHSIHVQATLDNCLHLGLLYQPILAGTAYTITAFALLLGITCRKPQVLNERMNLRSFDTSL